MEKVSHSVSIAKVIAPNLMLRGIADAFFDKLEKMAAKRIVVDFAGVESISRSFAHQYLGRKRGSSKAITEVNLSTDISRMLELVKHSSSYSAPKLALPKIDQAKVITV